MRGKLVGVVVALSLALGCGGQGSSDAEDEELVLRSYSAPGRAESLAQAIGEILRLGERRVGRARVGHGDQLLVLAPRSVHEGLAELVRAQANGGGAAAPASIAMTYWFVAARRAEEPAVPAALREIQPALDEILGVQGPHRFRLVERIVLQEAPGGPQSSSEASSPKVRISQRASISNGNVVGWIDANLIGPNRIQTSINLRPSQFLVLAQLGLSWEQDPFMPERPPKGREALASETALYVIVRAEVDQSS